MNIKLVSEPHIFGGLERLLGLDRFLGHEVAEGVEI